MQNLATTPLCQWTRPNDIVGTHRRYFMNMIDCPNCHHIREVCTCKININLKKIVSHTEGDLDAE